MYRKLIFVALMLLLPGLLYGQCTGSSPTWSCTLTGNGATDATNLQNTINSASSGDTINVTGTTTISTTINISKALTLNGQGTTTITANGTSGACGSFAISAVTTSNVFFTGFTILGHSVPGVCPASIQTFISASTLPFRIYNNTFTDAGASSPIVLIRSTGQGQGLIDHNTFNCVTGDEAIQVYGGNPPATATWTTDVVPGSANMLFVETNTFNNIACQTCSTTNLFGAINNYYGAVSVFRNNKIVNGASLDAHATSSSGISPRWVEWYNNEFDLPGTSPNYHLCCYWQQRGGSGVMFGNTSTGAPNQAPFPSYSFGPNSGSSDITTGPYPLSGNVGRGINQAYSPVYSFANPFTAAGFSATFPGYVQIGTSPNSSSCVANGTTGHPANLCDVVITANQPSPLTRCESAADVSAGCPVTYVYSPFPYPHPLTSNVTSTITFSPNPAIFGSVPVGSNVNLTITVSNTGSGSQTGATYTIAGTDYSDTHTGSCGVTIPAGTNCTEILKFTPTTSGTRTGTLTVGGTTTASVPLTGTGTAPAVQLSRSIISFGPQNVGVPSANVNTVVTNTGTANLTVSSIAVTGTDAANYAINTNTCTVTIPPGNNCSFNAVFTPGGVGTFNNAFATVTSNAPTSPNDKVTLNGSGQNPVTVTITVTPSPIAFGNQIQGIASLPITVTVKSTGTANWVAGTPYANVVAGGTNPIPGDFGLAAPGVTPCSNGLSLAPNVTCTFTVTAILSQLLLETAQLNVNGTVNASVQISGTGLPVGTNPAPAPALFANYPLPRTIDVTVTNCLNPCKIRVTCVSGCNNSAGLAAKVN